jgi:photosystem II stability/assembly factor-like uncharacterized protein
VNAHTIVLTCCLALATVGSVEAADAAEAPASHDVTWTLAGPGGGGWIQSIAWHPHEPDTLYVGCDVGGFYYSTDAGRSYEIRNTGLRNYFVECIAPHPTERDVILLGTEGGVYRTEDRGLHWERMGQGFPPIERYRFSAPIGALCYDPANADVCYAGLGRPRWGRDGSGTILRSDDGGRSWRNVTEGQIPGDAIVSDIEVQPGNSRTILAATTAGVCRSDDAGQTWRPSSDSLPHKQTCELAFAASQPNVVYVSLRTTARGEQTWDGGVYRSGDAGRTWRAANGRGMPMQLGRPNQPSEMTSGIKEIAVDPRDADVVYAGSTAWVTDGVYKTTDGGGVWERVAYRGDHMAYGWLTEWGPTAQCMALSAADPVCVAFGTSGHVFVTDNAGGFWEQRYCRTSPDGRFAGTGLEVTCLNRVVADALRPDRLYACFMDIGLLRSEDAGSTWRRLHEGMQHDGNCFAVLVDPQAPQAIWAATGEWGRNVGLICRSDDEGTTWTPTGTPETGLPNGQNRWLLMDPRSPVGARRLLCTSNGNGLCQSRDGGRSWSSLNGDMAFRAVADPRALLMDPADPGHLIAAFGGSPENGSGVYESRDAGLTWQRVNAEPLFNNITDLAADPRDFATLYLTAREQRDNATGRQFAGGVYKSADAGRTWERLLDYHFVDCVAVHPAVPGVLYVGTTDHPYHDDYVAEGVLKSADGGRTWAKVNDGLSLLNISTLAIDPHDPARLYAGSGGNALFLGRDRTLSAP